MIRKYDYEVNGTQYHFDGNLVAILESKKIENGGCENILEHNENTTIGKMFLHTIALNVINSCNLTCDYCFARQGNYDNPGQIMSFETAKKAIDLVVESVKSNEYNEVRIAFFGGEPMLKFDLIKQVVEYTQSLISDFEIKARYYVTTNGTIISDEIKKYFNEFQFEVMLSLDGEKDVHDFYRTFNNGEGSYDKAIDFFNKVKIQNHVIGRITVNENNTMIDQQVKHLVDLGFKEITFAYDYSMSNNSFKLFNESLDKLFNEYLLDIKAGKYYMISNITNYIQSIVLNKKRNTLCGAGRSYLTISADSEIYKCPRFTGEKEHSLGRVEMTTNNSLASEIHDFTIKTNEVSDERPYQCRECEFLYLCGGMCFHHSFEKKEGNQFAYIMSDCEYKKLLMKKSIKLLTELSINERRQFLLFISNVRRNALCSSV